MRQIEVSIDVYAKIWAARRPGEDSEDAILRRLLLTAASITDVEPASRSAEVSGFRDSRYDVRFEEGFEIFRTYKGQRFSAKASGGCWVTPDGKKFPSINKLSTALIQRPENAWANWNYVDAEGKTRRIAELRDSNKISQRTSPNPTTWRDDVVEVLASMGGEGSLQEIYALATHLRRKRKIPIPPNANAIIRRVLEENSSDSSSFTGQFDLFRSVSGIGSGRWALRSLPTKSI